MHNLRESEIRENSLGIVVETHRVANLIKTPIKPNYRTKLVDAAFLISARIAKAFNVLQNDQIESEIKSALKGISRIKNYIKEIETKSLLEYKEIHPLSVLLDEGQIELEALLISSQSLNNDPFSLKLEKACI